MVNFCDGWGIQFKQMAQHILLWFKPTFDWENGMKIGVTTEPHSPLVERMSVGLLRLPRNASFANFNIISLSLWGTLQLVWTVKYVTYMVNCKRMNPAHF